MNKANKNIFIIAGTSLLLLASTLFFFHVKSYYLTEKDRLEKKIGEVFDKAVKKDADIRRGTLTGDFQIGSAPSLTNKDSTIIITENDTTVVERKKDTTMEERIQASIQAFLYYKNPAKAEVIDSIFQSELKINHIDIPTAIMIVDHKKDSISYSADISGLTPVRGEPLSLGSSNKQSVQGFIQLSTGFILGRMPAYYWYTAGGWLLLVIGLGIFIPCHHKRIKRNVSQHLASQVIELSDPASSPVMQEQKNKNEEYNDSTSNINDLIKNNSDKVILLNRNVYFNATSRILFYNETQIPFTPLMNNVLQAFIKAPDHTISIENLKKKAWKQKEVSDETVRKSVSRLKKELEEIPGEGYRLKTGCL